MNRLDTEKVAIVDDDAITRYLIGRSLRDNDIDTYECESAEDLFDLLDTQRIGVIVLDLVLPNVNGLEALRYLRRESNVGVIMISSRANPQNRIEGLSIGADDFIAKPVSAQELVYKIRTLSARVTRERGKVTADTVDIGNCQLRLDDFSVHAKGTQNTIQLTPSERNLLVLLSQNKSRVCERKVLQQGVNRAELTSCKTRSVDTLISRIRRKLNRLQCSARIQSVRGQGYRLVLP